MIELPWNVRAKDAHRTDEYFTVRFEIEDGQCDYYVDDDFITTLALNEIKSGLRFSCDGKGGYIRNLSVEIDD